MKGFLFEDELEGLMRMTEQRTISSTGKALQHDFTLVCDVWKSRQGATERSACIFDQQCLRRSAEYCTDNSQEWKRTKSRKGRKTDMWTPESMLQ